MTKNNDIMVTKKTYEKALWVLNEGVNEWMIEDLTLDKESYLALWKIVTYENLCIQKLYLCFYYCRNIWFVGTNWAQVY